MKSTTTHYLVFNNLFKEDNYMSAEEAVEYGIADKIVGLPK